MNQKKSEKLGFVSSVSSQMGLGIALSLGLLMSTYVYTSFKSQLHQTITVKGYTEKSIVSEHAVWRGAVIARHPDLILAYKLAHAQHEKLNTFILNSEIDKKDLTNDHEFKKNIIYKRSQDGKNTTNEVDHYEVFQYTNIQSNNVKSIENLKNTVESLNQEGCEIVENQARFYYPNAKLEDVKLQMIADATKNAHQRAAQFANNGGGQVGRLMNARQGVFQVEAPNTPSNGYDSYDTSSVNKIVRLVVTLDYNIK